MKKLKSIELVKQEFIEFQKKIMKTKENKQNFKKDKFFEFKTKIFKIIEDMSEEVKLIGETNEKIATQFRSWFIKIKVLISLCLHIDEDFIKGLDSIIELSNKLLADYNAYYEKKNNE